MVKRLEEMCSVKVVTVFCCLPQMKEKITIENIITKRMCVEYYSEFITVNAILQQEFLNMFKTLPILIRDLLPHDLISFIANDLMKWIRNHIMTFDLTPSYCINFINSSFFTNRGKLDESLAATELVQDENLNIVSRFQIATHYFLIENSRTLWMKTNEFEKNYIQQRFIKEYEVSPQYWVYYVLREVHYLATNCESEMDDTNLQYVCEYALRSGIVPAFRNSWTRLSFLKKEALLEKLLDRLVDSMSFLTCMREISEFVMEPSFMEIFRFLLYDGNEEVLQKLLMQKDLREKHSIILNLCLFWPFQDIFIKMLNLVWEAISNYEFYFLLHSIVRKMTKDKKCCKIYNFNFRLFLKDIWLRASSDYKTYFCLMESEGINVPAAKLVSKGLYHPIKYVIKNRYISDCILSNLFGFEMFNKDDLLFVKLITNDISADDKHKILMVQGDHICENALLSGRPWLADLFIEAFVERELLNVFKTDFLTRRGNFILHSLRSSGKDNFADEMKNWASDLKFELEDLDIKINEINLDV